MKPLVSILIPCYNAEQWLAETLESALAQTWKNIEIIVVDDGSTDNSLAIAKSYESQQVKVISQLNKGASAARNLAYKSSKGDYIQYLDADDLLAPDKIQRQVEFLLSSPDTLTTCEWARFYRKPEEAQFIPQVLWQDWNPVDFLITAWKGNWMMHPAAWLIPRPICEKTGCWNEALSLNDDGEYFARAILASQTIKFCWGAKSYYRSGNSTSLSASKSHTAWQSAFQALESGTSNLLAKEDSPRTRQVCAMVFQRFIYEIYPDAPELRSQSGIKIKALGGSNIKPIGGPLFQLVSAIAGWKTAKRFQKFLYQHGYHKIALDRMMSLIAFKVIREIFG